MDNSNAKLLFLKKYINEQKKRVTEERKKGYFIKDYKPKENVEDLNFIKVNKEKLFTFLDDGYRLAGLSDGFIGCNDAKSLQRNANLMRIAYLNDEIIALSVYTGYQGGYKCVGITATTNDTLRDIGIQAVHDIVKIDIGFYNEFFWVECSDAIEHIYKKYNGIQIPSIYASYILNKQDIVIVDDFHYKRSLLRQDKIKTIFGFNNQETLDKVMSEYGTEIQKNIDFIHNNILNENKDIIDNLKISYNVIYLFVEMYWEGIDQFPSGQIANLKKYVEYMKNNIYHVKSDNILYDKYMIAIENAEDMLEEISEIKIYHFV